MKKLAIIALAAIVLPAFAQTYVSPYTRRDGTQVEGHWRTAPNSTVDDNYSTRGNVNPYTGQAGTEPRSYERPYQPPASIYTPPPTSQQCGYNTAGRYVCR